MAIVNRDKDSSEQVYVVAARLGDVATGVSSFIQMVPSVGNIQSWAVSGKGLSGAPVYQLAVARWTSAGITAFALGSAITLAGAFGLSGGVLGATFNTGSYAAQEGDMLVLNSSGANTASQHLVVSVVIKATQDIKKSFGIPV